MEKLVYGGDGLARLDGRVVFAPFVLPGERIRAQAEQEKPGLVRARTLEVLDRAPERVAAALPVLRALRRLPLPARAVRVSARGRSARSCVEELRRLGKIEPPRRDRRSFPASRGAIATARSSTSPNGRLGLSGGALAQALRDRPLPHQLAQSE